MTSSPGGQPQAGRVPTDNSPEGVYSKLRAMALGVRREDAGIPAPPAGKPAWGVVMETGYPGATATLMVLQDGTASLYISNGGGVIGGFSHESVRRAGAQLLEAANAFVPVLAPAADTPVPPAGQTVFWVLTDAGILTGGAAERDLGEGRDRLSALFHAAHGVITELRLISEAERRQG